MAQIEFEIDYAREHGGWISCWVVVDGEGHKLMASYAFPPFLDLLRFVKAVAGQRLPAEFDWDEEGVLTGFRALPAEVPPAADSPFVRLMIHHNREAAPWIDAVLEREAVVQAFLPPLLDLAKNFRRLETSWQTPRYLFDRVAGQIAAGIPLRSDVDAPQPVTARVCGAYGHRYVEGTVYLKIELEEEIIGGWYLMFDTNPFWPEWLAFCGKIAANLPAECEFVRHVNLLPGCSPYVCHTRFVAEPVSNQGNFRFKIFRQTNDESEPFLLLEEVVDRAQFAGGFLHSWEQFLAGEYRVMADSQGKTFDLRGLLEKA